MPVSIRVITSALHGSIFATLGAGSAFALTEGRIATGGTYVSGGIALEERAALDARRSGFSLWVVTAAKNTGSYLADVRVKVVDEAGRTLLDTTLDGPWLLIDLKRGRYAVEVSFRGQTRRKTTTIHEGDHHEMLFYFDLEVETLAPGEKN